MPYVLRDSIYGYIAQTQSFVSGDVANFTIILYKDSLNNQLDVVNYDQITVEVFDYLKRKKVTFARIPGAGEHGLQLGNKGNGEEGHVSFTLDAALTPLFDTGEVYVKITITQSSYVNQPISIQLPFLRIADKLSNGTGSTGGSKQLPSNYKATVPSTLYSVGDLSLSVPNSGQITFNSNNPTSVTGIKIHNVEQAGKLNVYLSSMVDVLNSGANLLITLTDFDAPDNYAIYRITAGGVIDANGNGGSFTDFEDHVLLGVQFMAASYTSTIGFNFALGNTFGILFDSYSGAGLQGPTGAAGAQGAAGANGSDGVDGTDGAQGAAGAAGLQGPAGPTGAQGAAGANGFDGIQGAQGADGE